MPSDERPKDVRLPTSRVAERYDVVTRTVERWEKDPRLGFPQPLKIHGRKYWMLADIELWEQERAKAAA